MYEGELAFEREILISGCLYLQKEEECNAWFLFTGETKTRNRSGSSRLYPDINSFTVLGARLDEIRSHLASWPLVRESISGSSFQL